VSACTERHDQQAAPPPILKTFSPSVYEPRYVRMFNELMATQAASGTREPAVFGHIIAPEHAPAELISDAGIAGWPKVLW
jgi:hypothetical protein